MKKVILQSKMLFATIALFFSLAATAQADKGVLLVNEFSNGANGSKEWAELLVANNSDGFETNVDISGWLFDDNNGIFNGTTTTGVGISSGHLRFTDSSIWKSIKAGTLVVLFNGFDFDSTNSAFVNANAAADGVYRVDNGSDSNFVFVAIGISPYVSVKTNTPIVTGSINNKRFYCDQNAYQITTTAWNAVALRNDSLGDGFQVRCPGCVDVPNFSDDPRFYHGASYGGQMAHVIVDSTVGAEGAYIAIPDSIGGTGKAFEFFQGTTLNSINADSNWRRINASAATPGFSNSSSNNTFRTDVADLVIAYPICSVFVPDTTPVKGVLVITEFSNGPSGSCEYVEILVAPCGSATATTVDIRGWVLDDNNGVFGAGNGKGITSGHLKFAELDTLKKVPVGTTIIVYNNADNCYGFAKDENYSDSILRLPIAGTSPTNFIVNNISATAISVKPTTTDSTYCAAAYASSGLIYEGRIGLGNTADGIQVRCPNCEPKFYHGASYGSVNVARTKTASDLGGPKLRNSSAGGRTFTVTSGGCNVGTASSWTDAAAPAFGSVPATANKVDTSVFNPIIVRRTCNLPCCPSSSGKSDFTLPQGNVEEVNFMVGNAYPNPALNAVSIDVVSVEDFVINFLDVTGRTVLTKNFTATTGTTVTFDVSNLAEGTYFVSVISENNKQTGRVVITR